MKLVLLGLAITTVLIGCTKVVWDKPGASQADYRADSYSCEKDARQSGYFGSGLVGALNMQDFFDRCMYAHGYTKQEISSSPPEYHGDPNARVVVGPPGHQSVLDGTGRFISSYPPPR
jgi:hypothetical protein